MGSQTRAITWTPQNPVYGPYFFSARRSVLLGIDAANYFCSHRSRNTLVAESLQHLLNENPGSEPLRLRLAHRRYAGSSGQVGRRGCDALIARLEIELELHFFPASTSSMVGRRATFLLANHCYPWIAGGFCAGVEVRSLRESRAVRTSAPCIDHRSSCRSSGASGLSES